MSNAPYINEEIDFELNIIKELNKELLRQNVPKRIQEKFASKTETALNADIQSQIVITKLVLSALLGECKKTRITNSVYYLINENIQPINWLQILKISIVPILAREDDGENDG